MTWVLDMLVTRGHGLDVNADPRRIINEVEFQNGLEIPVRRMKWITARDVVQDEPLGNHFHKETREFFWVIEGEIAHLKMVDIETGSVREWEHLGPGSVVRVEPRVWHSLLLGQGCLLAVVSSTTTNGELWDTFKLEDE